jgi:electron transport complex protein RnfB
VVPLDPLHGVESVLRTAVIDEDWCIGCTLCIKACPVDCIVGASKRMHTVIEAWCTGCMEPTGSEATGWAAWSPEQADEARQRYRHRQQRLATEREAQEQRLAAKAAAKLADLATASSITDPQMLDRKRSVIETALARARARQSAKS